MVSDEEESIHIYTRIASFDWKRSSVCDWSPEVIETSFTSNSPPQESSHPDDLFQSRHVTSEFKPFS